MTEASPGRPPAGPDITPPRPGPDSARDRVVEHVVRLTSDDTSGAERRSLLLRVAALLAKAGARSGRAGLRWLADTVVDLAPRLPVRDLATLQAHHPGLTGEALADALVANAAKTTAGICAAGGALAAAEFAAPPTLLGAPVQVAAETLAIVAVELKLVAELHAVYGLAVPGTSRQRATSYTVAWARQTGADRLGIGTLTGTARRQLQARLLRRFGRTSLTVAPFLAGAVAGALLGHRGTRRLGDKVRGDLRRASSRRRS